MDQDTLDTRFRLVSILWASLLWGVTLIAAMAFALSKGLLGAAPPPLLSPHMAATLLVLSPVLMAVGIAYRHGEVAPHDDPGRWLSAYQARVILAAALQEAGALLGLVVCLLAGKPTWTLGVWGMAAAAMAFSRPRRDDLRRLTG